MRPDTEHEERRHDGRRGNSNVPRAPGQERPQHKRNRDLRLDGRQAQTHTAPDRPVVGQHHGQKTEDKRQKTELQQCSDAAPAQEHQGRQRDV